MELIKVRLIHPFIRERIKLTWREIKFGLDHDIMDSDAAIEFAVEQVACEAKPSADLLEVAEAHPGSSISRAVDRLAQAEARGSEEQTRQKWMFLVLAWIYAHRDEFDDPLERVADAYADFGYPEEIASIVYYMPNEGDQGNREGSVERMIERWKQYLEKAGAKYRP
ncbi:hypothetical protein ABI59_00760 [Acidobacteria bacterium Mor1]|nr:hypothetical protein ABI59_00760 [Acidobacteria bacterium Mor1]